MRASLIAVTLLSLPLIARADSIDYFSFSGDGHTITYSLPATSIVPDHPHIVTLNGTAPTTIDGVSGYTEFGTYFLPGFSSPDMTLSVPSTIYGGQINFYGPYLVSFYAIPTADPTATHPDDLVVTFLLGTFDLTATNLSFSSASAPYTLVISALPPSATPEPASLILLATGALGMLAGRIRRAAIGI